MKKLKIFLDPKPWLLLVADGKSMVLRKLASWIPWVYHLPVTLSLPNEGVDG